MSLMEQTNKIDCLGSISNQIGAQYEQRNFGKRICFIKKNGIPFNVFAFPGENALCIEYAENEEDATAGRFEDGDLFYLMAFDTEAALLAAMIAEIEETT